MFSPAANTLSIERNDRPNPSGGADTGQEPFVSVVVPCFNEADCLPHLYSRLTEVCEGLFKPYEIVLVNDGSTDRTCSLMSRMAERDGRLVLVNLSRNFGKEAALTAGLQLCRGDRVLIIDADLQDPPELLPEMLALIDEGADVVYARRTRRAGETAMKRATAALFYRLLNFIANDPIPRDAGDFRLLSRRAVDAFLRLPEQHRFVRGLVSWVGFRQVPIEFDRAARFAGNTKWSPRRLVALGADAVTAFSTRPLALATWFGGLFSIVACGLAARLLLGWGNDGRYDLFLGMLAALAFTSSVQLLALGLIGSYLGRLYEQSRGRPLFIVQDVVRGGAHRAGVDGKKPASARPGFTIIELLVTIGIIGVLMAILLPAVQQAREAARATQCASNLRNIALAMLAHADAKRRFPALGNFSTSGVRYHSWVVPLLPLLERADIHAQWDYDKPADVARNNVLARTSINVLTCPDDDTVVRGEGNLSFAVNSGFGFTIPMDCPATYRSAHSPTPGVQPIDLNGNGIVTLTQAAPDGSPSDRSLLYQCSLFFVENWPRGEGTQRHHSADSVRDGLSQTLMLAENIRAGYDPYTGANWAWPDPQRAGFLLSGYICANASCSAGSVDYRRANGRSGGPWQYESLNAARDQAEGQAPWPSSYHPAGVQTIFADGHLHVMPEAVDGAVYAALVTPQGILLESPLNQRLISDGNY